MATTTRLPDDLKTEAECYARSLGVSLNALMAVALRDYLDQRRRASAPDVRQSAEDFYVEAARYPQPKTASSPCPCGSRRQYRDCHGKVKPGR